MGGVGLSPGSATPPNAGRLTPPQPGMYDDFCLDEDAGVAYVSTHREDTISEIAASGDGFSACTSDSGPVTSSTAITRTDVSPAGSWEALHDGPADPR
jgi:hypothetical protein